MRKPSKNIFFLTLFIFFFTLILFSSFSPFVHAGKVNNPMITTDVLSVQLGQFKDNTPGDGSGKLNYITGGYDLLSFENYGEVSRDLDTNTVVYGAHVKWGWEVTGWTSTLFRDIYPKINIDNIEEEWFLSYQIWKHLKFLGIKYGEKQQDSDVYYINYHDIDYGNVFKAHNYHGYIPITVSIAPGLKYSGEVTVAGQSFTVPTLTSDILHVRVDDMRSGDCGSYQDRYSDQGINGTTVKLMAEPLSWSYDAKEVMDWFNSHDWDFKRMTDDTITEQQSVIDKSFERSRYDSPDISNEFIFDLPIHIQPEVTKVRQYFTMTKGHFHWYTCGCGFRQGPTIITKRIQRDISVYVQNVFVHYDLEMESDLFMTCQFTGNLSQSFLDDPDLIISDMIWDTSIWGDESVEIVLPEINPWMDILMWIVIILVLIIVGYLIYRYFKKKRQVATQIYVGKKW